MTAIAIIAGWFAVATVTALLLGRIATRLKGPR